MSKLQKVIITIGIVILPLVIFHLVNFSIISELVVGDECKYDTTDIKTSKLFDLFYETSSDTGYHPEPSIFIIVFVWLLGIITGLIFSFRKIWTKY